MPGFGEADAGEDGVELGEAGGGGAGFGGDFGEEDDGFVAGEAVSEEEFAADAVAVLFAVELAVGGEEGRDEGGVVWGGAGDGEGGVIGWARSRRSRLCWMGRGCSCR